jgi:hypothetical protein
MAHGPLAPEIVRRARTPALVAGGACLAVGLSAAALAGGFERALHSWLAAFVFWTGIALGCLALGMLHVLTGGGWGVPIRRPLEAAAATLPVLFLAFLPLGIFAGSVWEWAAPGAAAHDPVLQHKHPYLNVPFFWARAVVYFALWSGLALLLVRGSDELDRTASERTYLRQRSLAGPGLALYVLTVTFAWVDWVMSLDAHWFSTIFGILTVGGQALGALAFVIAVLVVLSRHEPLSHGTTAAHFHDVGKLLLAFVMLWAYFAFSQFLIVWAGNLPEEIPWYLRRLETGWRWIALAIALLHFALPFVLLLSADLKRRSRRLAGVALLVLVMRMVDTIWLIGPESHAGALPVGFALGADLLTIAGFGGLWLALFSLWLARRPVLPLHDPNLAPGADAAESHA